MPAVAPKPSSSVSSWLRACSSVCSPLMSPRAETRVRPSVSISSMNTMAGAICFASVNRSRTRVAPWPTVVLAKSLAATEKKAALVSDARALAIRVLPQPGGPYRSMPRGIRAPRAA